MAFGDIHNHNGSMCKAKKRPCPLGDEGHSKNIEDFIEHHVEESALDADSVRSMIADGTPPADAIEVAKSGGGWIAKSMSFVDLTDDQMDLEDEMDAQVNEEAYGYLRDLKGNERREEIAKVEKIMASEYDTSAMKMCWNMTTKRPAFLKTRAHFTRLRWSVSTMPLRDR